MKTRDLLEEMNKEFDSQFYRQNSANAEILRHVERIQFHTQHLATKAAVNIALVISILSLILVLGLIIVLCVNTYA